MVEGFTVDEEAATVTCPARDTVALSRTRAATFGALCCDCPLHHLQDRPASSSCTNATACGLLKTRPHWNQAGGFPPRPRRQVGGHPP